MVTQTILNKHANTTEVLRGTPIKATGDLCSPCCMKSVSLLRKCFTLYYYYNCKSLNKKKTPFYKSHNNSYVIHNVNFICKK